MGFGFVEVGTVLSSATGNDKPRLFRLVEAEGIINHEFNNLGVGNLDENVKKSNYDALRYQYW